MRSIKYHDYRAVKVALFIILVILGLLFYVNCIMPSFEHTAGEDDWTVLTAATCTEDGLRCKICTDCGEEFDHEVIPATGHRGGRKVVAKATCTENGLEQILCWNCDYEFSHKVLEATGHKPGDSKPENYEESTCTVGGSYDDVVYCKTCNEELSREKVDMELKPHNYGPAHQENVLEPTHTQPGTYEAVSNCIDCNHEKRVPSVSEPTGHEYSWELTFNDKKREFVLTGTCDCDEDGNVVVYNKANGLRVLDSNIPNCCRTLYTVVITINGKDLTINLRLDEPIVPHSIEVYGIDAVTGEFVPMNVYVTQFAKYDEIVGEYYDYDIDGMIFLNLEGNEWDENGFALGAFKCIVCEENACEVCTTVNGQYWYIVHIYNYKYDNRLKEN